MSATALKWVRTQMPRARNGGPDPHGKLILLQLAMMHNDRPDIDLFPGQQTLSEQTGLSVWTIGERLKSLTVQGYLTRVPRHHKQGARRGQRTTDAYVLNLNRPEDDLTQRGKQPAGLASNKPTPRTGSKRRRELNYENFGTDPEFPATRTYLGAHTWEAKDLAAEIVDLLEWIGYPNPPKASALLPAIQDLDNRYGCHPVEQRASLRDAFLNKTQVEAWLRRGLRGDQAALEVLITVAVRKCPVSRLRMSDDNGDEHAKFCSIDGSTYRYEHECRANDLNFEFRRYGISLQVAEPQPDRPAKRVTESSSTRRVKPQPTKSISIHV